MTSFKTKLRNIINDSLEKNSQRNLEKNLNQSLIDTRRKINKNIIFMNTDKNNNIQTKRNNIKESYKNFYFNNDNYLNRNKSQRIKNCLFNKKANMEKLSLNEISVYLKYNSDCSDINKKYKNLYNNSLININNNIYNKNKTYLHYKNNSISCLNNYINKENISSNKNSQINNSDNKLMANYTALSTRNIEKKRNSKIKSHNNSIKSDVKPNNLFGLKKKRNSYILYDNYINNKIINSEKDVLITKNKHRISNAMKKKINLLIGENGLNNLSYKNNIANKAPRILNSELFKFDKKYYNDISPLKKYMYLNKKSKNYFKSFYNIEYNNNSSSSKN